MAMLERRRGGYARVAQVRAARHGRRGHSRESGRARARTRARNGARSTTATRTRSRPDERLRAHPENDKTPGLVTPAPADAADATSPRQPPSHPPPNNIPSSTQTTTTTTQPAAPEEIPASTLYPKTSLTARSRSPFFCFCSAPRRWCSLGSISRNRFSAKSKRKSASPSWAC